MDGFIQESTEFRKRAFEEVHDKRPYPNPSELRHETAELLRTEVAAMNPHNFVVRPQRALVEKYAQPEAWSTLNPDDFAALERILLESGVGSADDVMKAKVESHSLGILVRSLIGLDCEAAKQAFAGFLAGTNMTANQIEFINLIVDHLTEYGYMEPERLYESPYTDLNPRGADGVFSSTQVDALVSILAEIRQRAAA